MKKLFAAAALILVGVMAWRVIHNLSSDAISMALGMFLGVVAGIPTALLLLSSNRRGERSSWRERDALRHGAQSMVPYGPGYPQQPPVIVITGAHGSLPPQSRAAAFPAEQGTNWQDAYWQEAHWPAPQVPHSHPSGRTFRIVGEPDHRDEA